MNIGHLRKIDIYEYDLPDEIKEGWCHMIEFIEGYHDFRQIQLKYYYEVFIQDMLAKGFNRDIVEKEFTLYLQELKNIREKQ